jgi:hypothetical protein
MEASDIRVAFPLGMIGAWGSAFLQEVNPLLSATAGLLTVVYLSLCIWQKLKRK